MTFVVTTYRRPRPSSRPAQPRQAVGVAPIDLDVLVALAPAASSQQLTVIPTRFVVGVTEEGLVSFRRDWGCGKAAMLAICRAIVGGRARVRDVTPAEVERLAWARSVENPYWREGLPIRFAARQRVGGLIEIERDCGSSPRDVLDLCESLQDRSQHGELDDTHYHRHVKLAS